MADQQKVRVGAEAILIFDRHEATDLASLSILRKLGWLSWFETVAVDESQLCQNAAGVQNKAKHCWRARGTFHIAGVPISLVNATAAHSQPDPLHISHHKEFQEK